MEQDNSYNDLLGQLKQHYDQNKAKIFVPSQEQYVNFTPISVKQHKDILRVSDNLILSGLQFNINTNLAILANIDAPKDNILLIDRASIILGLKQSMAGDNNTKITIDDVTHLVDLKAHTNGFEEIKFNKGLLKKNISLGAIKVACSVPSISKDIEINKIILQTLQDKTEDSLLSSVGDVYVYELLKFIDTIDISGNVASFSSLTTDQKLQLCNMLPLELSNMIITYINQIKAIDQKYTKCTDIEGNIIEIPLSVTLFAGD